MSDLFSAFSLRGVEFHNRVFVSPMCQYSSRDGMPDEWHMVHLGSRAVGGAALVMVEATAVSPEGRISPGDTGIWSDEQARAFAPIAAFIKSQGAVPAIQLAHAGRKASTNLPWRGGKPLSEDEGGWQTLAPSAVAFGNYPSPREMTAEEIERVTREFAESARRSLAAGFEVAELHMAHGYLLHEFLSPLSNQREDEFGGSLEGRMHFPLRVAEAVRRVWPDRLPLFARISATDWVEGGWDVEHSVELARRLLEAGVDLIDCSSGGLVPGAKIAVGPGYQVPFAARIREEASVATGAVGMITEAHQAEEIVSQGKADAIFLARAMLRDPYWPLHAARTLGAHIPWPVQYERAKD
ncbi:MAG TPA: NADH:flavin oxidoreductase/NADH oxidase [Pyrinomonadaceae bacterium]|nr:NADH:flavin oxidoreductase/NADH oxidase [Pyrinomonadaceae bacterium]